MNVSWTGKMPAKLLPELLAAQKALKNGEDTGFFDRVDIEYPNYLAGDWRTAAEIYRQSKESGCQSPLSVDIDSKTRINNAYKFFTGENAE